MNRVTQPAATQLCDIFRACNRKLLNHSAANFFLKLSQAELHRTLFLYQTKLGTNQTVTMAVAEENWQTKCLAIAQRTTFIFNTKLLSDVKFAVPASTGESKRRKVIPAHKFVLAISSPVFYAMFYGQMAETTDSIELPDCDYESLLEMFRYLYCDKVNLSGSNVMQLLYLANKYMMPSLTEKCAKYLRRNLKASNVFCILPCAQKFQDKDLEDRCWEVILKQTEEAIKSEEFVTVERSLVETVVTREVLNVKEVELFKAVDRWATEESKRLGITPDGESKRRILGERILKAIRFPLMSQQEFASVVMDSKILTSKEVIDMVMHFNDLLTSSLPFIQAPREAFSTLLAKCRRFQSFEPPGHIGWSYRSSPDCLIFSVNKPIMLHGVQHFGSDGGNYTVSTEVKDTTDGSSLVKQSGSYASEKDKTCCYYGFSVLFDRPVRLMENKKYKLESLIKGPKSWYGIDGETYVKCQGVAFTFHASPVELYATNQQWASFVTNKTMGQFPILFWSASR